MVIIFSDDSLPPSKKKINKHYLDSNSLIFSIIPVLHLVVLTMKAIFTIPILHKSKEREVNFGTLSYWSPWACGIWPIIGIFPIRIDECQSDLPWVIFSPRINGITAILIIVTFIRFTAVSTCPVVIYYACRMINYVCALSFLKTIETPEGIEYIQW